MIKSSSEKCKLILISFNNNYEFLTCNEKQNHTNSNHQLFKMILWLLMNKFKFLPADFIFEVKNHCKHLSSFYIFLNPRKVYNEHEKPKLLPSILSTLVSTLLKYYYTKYCYTQSKH